MRRNKWPLVGVSLLTFVLSAAFSSAAQTTFKKSKMYVTQGNEMKLRKVELTFTETALVVQGMDKRYREKKTVPYEEIKKAEYEYSKHHRVAAAVIISPLLLLSKAKKYWLTLTCKPMGEEADDEELVFRLDKKNYREILAAIEESTEKKVERVPTKS